MAKMLSRWRQSIPVGAFLLLIVPSTILAQQAAPTPADTQAATSAPQPIQAASTSEQADRAASAQKPESQPASRAQAAKAKDTKSTKGTWKLKVSSERAIDLKADRALVAEIAAQLSQKFEVPVLLSPVMQKARLSIDFLGMPLEGALRMIAPQPYADYEVSGDGSALPKVVAIYLYALNEPPPSESAVVRGDSEAILISGDTEESTETASEKDKQEKSLSVKMERNQITVHARKQPLTAVLYEIASKFDIPFEMKHDSSELVNVDLKNATMEQVVRALSPNIRLYQRTDLQTYETKPLRLVLAQPASQTIKM